MRKKWLTAVLALCLACCLLCACGDEVEKAYRLPYYDQTGEASFDKDLFYQNDMTVKGADPSVIYIDDAESEDYGYFYMYPTSDYDFNVGAFAAYRSRNLIDWEFVSAAFVPEQGSWAKTRLFAPECVYDSATKKYYLFFSAQGYERDGLYFDSSADINAYRAAKAKYDKITNLETLEAEIDTLNETFKTAEEEMPEIDGYTEKQTEEVRAALKDYAERKKDIMDGDGSADSKNNALKPIARAVLLQIETVKISKKSGGGEYSLGMAIGDSPRGPFVQYTNVEGQEGYDENKRTIDKATPYITHEDFYEFCGEEAKEGLRDVMTMIDAHPFEAPDGNKYLYFSATQPSQEYIYGIKIGKNWTDEPDWDSVTAVSRHLYKTVDGSERTDYRENRSKIDEAPFVYYDSVSQKYLLTFSVNGCYDKTYCVAQAIGDTPLGPFTKVDRAKGGFVISADPSWDHVSGPGHHSFVEFGGKLYIAYQGVYNRKYPTEGSQRGVCVDEVKFVTNQDGQRVLYANGPSYAPMPLIGNDAAYKNIAEEATVTATNAKDGSSASLLNDGLVTYTLYHDIVREYQANGGKTEITLAFGDYRAIRAIQIFNSKLTDMRFEKIDRIELDFTYTDKDGNEITDTAYMKNLAYDFDRYTTHWNGELADMARPGGSVCVEFDELKVKTIRITIDSAKPVNISEIFVLGK